MLRLATATHGEERDGQIRASTYIAFNFAIIVDFLNLVSR